MKSLVLSGADFRNTLLCVKSQTIGIQQDLSRINLSPYEYHLLSQEDCEGLLQSPTVVVHDIPAAVAEYPTNYFWFMHTSSGELIFVEPEYSPDEIAFLAEPLYVRLAPNSDKEVYHTYEEQDGFAKIEAKDLKARDARYFVRMDQVECIQLWRLNEADAKRLGYPSLNEFRMHWVEQQGRWQGSAWALVYHYSLTAKPAAYVHETEAQER